MTKLDQRKRSPKIEAPRVLSHRELASVQGGITSGPTGGHDLTLK